MDYSKLIIGDVLISNNKTVIVTTFIDEETGRVVNFGTAYPNEYYFEAYENGTLEPTLTRYWYPEDERYGFK